MVPVQDTEAEPKCPHSTMKQEVIQPLKEARLTGIGVCGISVTLRNKPYWDPVLDNDRCHVSLSKAQSSALRQ